MVVPMATRQLLWIGAVVTVCAVWQNCCVLSCYRPHSRCSHVPTVLRHVETGGLALYYDPLTIDAILVEQIKLCCEQNRVLEQTFKVLKNP